MDASGNPLRKGASVEHSVRGHLKKGRVTKLRPNGSVDIEFSDGTQQLRVAPHQVALVATGKGLLSMLDKATDKMADLLTGDSGSGPPPRQRSRGTKRSTGGGRARSKSRSQSPHQRQMPQDAGYYDDRGEEGGVDEHEYQAPQYQEGDGQYREPPPQKQQQRPPVSSRRAPPVSSRRRPQQSGYASDGGPLRAQQPISAPPISNRGPDRRRATSAPTAAGGGSKSGRGGGSGDSVSVGVRLRPLNSSEVARGETSQAFVADPGVRTCIELGEDGIARNMWSFDAVFDETDGTGNVYEQLGRPIVEMAIEGFNGTIFAYGQTSSGKTHTMFGNSEQPGLITYGLWDIFTLIKEAKFSEFLVRVSYVELYNEQLHDLLNPSTQSDNLRIAEDPKSGPYVKNCTETIVTSAEQALELIKKGEMSRHYGATRMNDMSSRSHVMFRCLIKRGFVSKTSGASGVMAAKAEPHDPADGEAIISNGEAAPWHDNPNIPHRISALYFVDLAGSEKTAKTGATGATLKESNSINKSLLTLGTVINRLSDGTRAQHIPYRDSKLTHLLSTSLGGNASTVMIATVSPAAYNREETVGTLRYASRAKRIVNVVELNEVDNMESFMTNYWSEVEALKKTLTEKDTTSATLSTELETTKSKLASAEREAQTTKSELESQANEAQSAAADEIDKLRNVERNLREELAARIDAAAEHTEELRAEYESKRNKLESEFAIASTGIAKDAEAAASSFEHSRGQLEERLAAAVSEVEALRSGTKRAEEDKSFRENTAAQVTAELEQLKTKAGQEREAAAAAAVAAKTAADTTIETLQAELREARVNAAKHEAEATAKGSALKTVEKSVDAAAAQHMEDTKFLQDQIEGLQARLEEMSKLSQSAAGDAAKAAILEHKLEVGEAKLAEAEIAATSAKAAAEARQAELNDRNTKLAELEKRLHESDVAAGDQLQQSERNIATALGGEQKRVRELEAHVQSLLDQPMALKDEHEKATAGLLAAHAEDLAAIKREHEQALLSADARRQGLDDEATEVANVSKAFRGKHGAVVAELEALQKTNATMAGKLAAYQKVVGDDPAHDGGDGDATAGALRREVESLRSEAELMQTLSTEVAAAAAAAAATRTKEIETLHAERLELQRKLAEAESKAAKVTEDSGTHAAAAAAASDANAAHAKESASHSGTAASLKAELNVVRLELAKTAAELVAWEKLGDTGDAELRDEMDTLRKELGHEGERYATEARKWHEERTRLLAEVGDLKVRVLEHVDADSPVVKRMISDRSGDMRELEALRDENQALSADFEKVLAKKRAVDDTLDALQSEQEALTSQIDEQAEESDAMKSENVMLRRYLDQIESAARRGKPPFDGNQSSDARRAGTLTSFVESIRDSIADELRRAFDSVATAREEVNVMKRNLSAQQGSSVQNSRSLTDEVGELRARIAALSTLQDRVDGFHHHASAVRDAHARISHTNAQHKAHRRGLEEKVRKAQAQAQENQSEVEQVDLNNLPDGFVIWYHSHVQPRLLALGKQENATQLLRPHPRAKVPTSLPEGIDVEVDYALVSQQMQMNPHLDAQLDRLVPHQLSQRQFWLHYFSHAHAIRLAVAKEAATRAATDDDGIPDDMSPGEIEAGRVASRSMLHDQFVAVLNEGVVLRNFADDGVFELLVWLSLDQTLLCTSRDVDNGFPPPTRTEYRVEDLQAITNGKGGSARFKYGPAAVAPAERCFSMSFATGQTLEFEATAEAERAILCEGLKTMVSARAFSNAAGGGGGGGGNGGGAPAPPLGQQQQQQPPPQAGGGGGGGGHFPSVVSWLTHLGLSHYAPQMDRMGLVDMSAVTDLGDAEAQQVGNYVGMKPHELAQFGAAVAEVRNGAGFN